MSELSKVEQLCAFIAYQGVARTTAIVQQFPDTNGSVFNILEGPLGNGFLVACKVSEPYGSRAREIWEYRLSEAAIGKTYAQWKADRKANVVRPLKVPKLSDRVAAAVAAAQPPVARPPVAGNPISARRQAAPQPAVGKNTGSARSVTSSGTPFAEARTVKTPPAAAPVAPAAERSGADEIRERICDPIRDEIPEEIPGLAADRRANTEFSPSAIAEALSRTSAWQISLAGATWVLSSDGALSIQQGDAQVLLTAREARRLAREMSRMSPLLDEMDAFERATP